MRFQDAAPDARAIVYASVQADPLVAEAASLLAVASPGQRVLARAVMNGESTDHSAWRTMFPTLFGPGVDREAVVRSDAILDVSLRVAARGDQVRSQLRGAIVESLTERLLGRRVGDAHVRRERRILFDGVRADIHPFDVTAETATPEAYDCKWGARGINGEVLLQLGAARDHAAQEGAVLAVALVAFDARRSCLVRLARQTVPTAGIGLVTIETLRSLAKGPPS